MLNQTFVFEATEVREVNGVRQEYYVKDYQLFYMLALSILAKIIWVYGNISWGFSQFLREKKLSIYFVRLGVLLVSSILFEIFLIKLLTIFLPYQGISLPTWMGIWQLNVLLYIFYYGVSQAYVLTKNWWQQERLNEQLEKENLATELNFLKSQINPHFLFNTLNNLFAIAEESQQPALSKGISGLSNLMRYMLDDCKADRVFLEKEIKFLHSVIEMQQLRIAQDDHIVISFNIYGDIAGQKIAPLILIPFVENAFKHGINWQESSFIKIDFRIEDRTLDFRVVNSYFQEHNSDQQKIGGLGLENVKRRLTLIYPETHSLDISVETDVFRVHLQLELDS